MRKLTTCLVVASVALTTPAFAKPAPTSVVGVTVGGATPPKCVINASANTISLPVDLSTSGGFVDTTLATKIAAQLNTAGISGWCSGNRNGLSISRSTLNHGDGQQTEDGFAQAIVYDLQVTVANALNVD